MGEGERSMKEDNINDESVSNPTKKDIDGQAQVQQPPPYTMASSQYTQYFTPAQFMYGSTSSYYPPQAELQNATDSDYSHFMAQHGGQVAPHVVYEAKRATRQMAHYFDVNQYKSQLDTGTTAPTPPEPGKTFKKLTKKELESFKKRREERKRIRNRWLFE